MKTNILLSVALSFVILITEKEVLPLLSKNQPDPPPNLVLQPCILSMTEAFAKQT